MLIEMIQQDHVNEEIVNYCFGYLQKKADIRK